MNLRQSLITLLVFTSSILTLVGQCDVTLGADILDNTTGSIEIIIEGAVNNDLSSADQGLCGIQLFFEHESIRDVSISLVSPSGQSVNLVGPPTGTGANTQFTYWGIEFVPCDSTAVTDSPIFGSSFSTLDAWGSFGSYNGKYYPYQGCLEDFNSGPVDGSWTLNFSDAFQFQEGVIDSIRLIFCDTDSIYCQECLADGGTLQPINSDYCESDPALNLAIDVVFDSIPPIDLYSYNYLIVQGGEVLDVNNVADLTGYNFGAYQVCGISSLSDQTVDLLDDVLGTDYDDLLQLFNDSEYCAALSNNCIPINIIEVPDTILTVDTICTGDVLILDGNEYSETGEYVISFSQAFCDSVSILNLFVIDNQASIIGDSDMISCSDNDVELDASASVMGPTTVMNWFKVNDVLDPNIVEDDLVITVTEAGVYGLSLITGMCSDTAYYEIFNDESIPSFTFDVDTLNCYNPSILIDMTPSIELQSVSWTGPVISNDEDILVSSSNTYYVEGVALNGCIGRDSIFIEEDFEVPVPIISGDILTCIVDTVTLQTTLPDSLLYEFMWEGPSIVDGLIDANTIQVYQDTIYKLNVINLTNGCDEEFEYEVLIDTNRTNFIIESSILDCNNLQSEITVSPAIDTIDFLWEYGSLGMIGIGDTITVDQDGEYQLVTITSNGCVDTFSHTVVQDTLEPVVLVDDVIITCLMDSIQLISITTESDLMYAWRGPGGFESNEASPYVYNPGIYILESLAPTGCMNVTTVNVMAGAGLPDLTFAMSDTLDCNVQQVTLTPNETLNLRFEWQSDLIADTTAYIVDVNTSGVYTLIVTDTLTGCNLLYEVVVPDDYDLPIPEVDVMTIDCNNSEVTLNTTFMVEVDSLRWKSDMGFNSTDISPMVNQGGDYYITAVGINGCIHTDTITVLEDIELPIIAVDVPLIDCLNPSVDISFSTDLTTDLLTIRLPNGDVVAQSTLSVTEPNVYMAIATSLSGCVDSMLMEVLEDTTAPIASLLTNGQINCTETTTTILVDTQEEGLTFDWSGVSITSPLGLDSIIVDAEGNYSVIVTDTANCATTLDIEIQSFIDFPVVSSTVDTINCNQSMANVALDIPANTILVTWEGPSLVDQDDINFATDIPGTYIASVTSDNNCVTQETIEVVLDTITPNIEAMTSGIIDCNIEFITLSGTSDLGGSIFQWTTPNNDLLIGDNQDVNEAGTYDLLVTAPNTCVMDTFVIVEVDTIKPTIVVNDEFVFSCGDGKLFLTIETTTNIISYAWEDPFLNPSDLEVPLAIAPGLYTVTVTNDLGCSTSAEIFVIDDTEGPEIMVRDTFITCDLLAVPLPLETNDNEVLYTWDAPGFSSDEQNPNIDMLGEYIVYAVSERNECVTVDTVNVTYVEVPPIYDVVSDNINCFQSQTTLKALDVEDDLSATWTDDNFNVLATDSLIVSMADSFYLVVIGANDCADTTRVMVEEDFELADLEILLNEPFQCDNTDVTLEGNVVNAAAMDDFSPSWTTTDGVITEGALTFDPRISGEGTYVLTVQNQLNGCESVDSIVMMKEAQSLFNLTLLGQEPNCLGFQDGSMAVTNVEGGFSPFQYVFDNGIPQPDSSFTDISSGTYDVQVIDSIGCKLDTSIVIPDGLDFMAIAESDTTIIVGDSINLNSVFNIPDEEVDALSWSAHNSDFGCDDCFEPLVNPLINTYYTLNATSIGGCQDSSQVLIRVNRNPDIDVANVFAPGSESNGLFYIQQTSGIERVVSMSVFDKWASRMFKQENVMPGDPSAAWDGTYKGQYVNPGVYVVIVELLLYSGEIVTYGGDITVLR